MAKNIALVGFCPICWSPVSKDTEGGKIVFKCPVHGAINFVLDEHPLAKHNEFVKHCDALGITNLEACC